MNNKIEVGKLWVLSYSHSQDAYHTSPLLEHVLTNSILHERSKMQGTDFCAIHLGTEEQCRARARIEMSKG